MTWHDWLNLSNLVAVSRVIVRAAQARENSRGAHFRADFPDAGRSRQRRRYTRVRAGRRRRSDRRMRCRSRSRAFGRDSRWSDRRGGTCPTSGFRTTRSAKRPKSRSAVHSSRTPWRSTQRSDACIVDERAGDSSFLQQGLQGWPVELGFRQQRDAGRFQPGVDLIERSGQWTWRRVNLRMRDDGHELVQARPRHGPRCATLGQFGDARVGSVMPGGVFAMGVNEDIRIDGDHPPRPSYAISRSRSH